MDFRPFQNATRERRPVHGTPVEETGTGVWRDRLNRRDSTLTASWAAQDDRLNYELNLRSGAPGFSAMGGRIRWAGPCRCRRRTAPSARQGTAEPGASKAGGDIR